MAHLSLAGLWSFQEFVPANVVNKVSHTNVKLSAGVPYTAEINSAHAVGHETKYMLHTHTDSRLQTVAFFLHIGQRMVSGSLFST